MSQIITRNTGGGGGGALNTLSDNVGTTINPNGSGNIQLEGQLNELGGGFFSTVTAGTNIAKINPMSSVRWLVDPLSTTPNPNGTHTNISDACAVATSGDTILIMPGTYTEDPVVPAGVNLCAYTCDGIVAGHVIILGKVTITDSGANAFSGICFQTNEDYCFQVTGSGSTTTYFIDCTILCDNDAIQLNANSTCVIFMSNCSGTIIGSNIKLFDVSNGQVFIQNCLISGSSTTPSTFSSASVLNVVGGIFDHSVQTNDTSSFNITSVIMGGFSGTKMILADDSFGSASFSVIDGGSSPAITVAAGCDLTVTRNVFTSAGSTGIITGSGDVHTDAQTLNGSSKVFDPALTVFPIPLGPSIYGTDGSLSKPAFSFATDPTCGFYRNGSFDFAAVVNGQIIMSFLNGAARFPVPVIHFSGVRKTMNIQTVSYNLTPNDMFVGFNLTTAVTATLPASPQDGQWYTIKDVSANAATNNITINGNGKNIVGGTSAATFVINTNGGSAELTFSGTTNTWLVT